MRVDLAIATHETRTSSRRHEAFTISARLMGMSTHDIALRLDCNPTTIRCYLIGCGGVIDGGII